MNSGQPGLARFPDNTVQHVPRSSAKAGPHAATAKSPGPSITLAAWSAIPQPGGGPGRRSLAKDHPLPGRGSAWFPMLSCSTCPARELIFSLPCCYPCAAARSARARGTRRLGCYKQAVFALAWFRDKDDIPRLGSGFGLPQSTPYRCLDEVIEVLAAHAPGLRGATGAGTGRGHAVPDPGRHDRGRRPVQGENARGRRSTCGTREGGMISAGTTRVCLPVRDPAVGLGHAARQCA